MSLALDVGLGRLTLSVEGIEVLLEPLVGRDARVDCTSQASLVVRFFIEAGFLAMRHALFSRRRSPRTTEFQRNKDSAKIGSDSGRFFEMVIE